MCNCQNYRLDKIRKCDRSNSIVSRELTLCMGISVAASRSYPLSKHWCPFCRPLNRRCNTLRKNKSDNSHSDRCFSFPFDRGRSPHSCAFSCAHSDPIWESCDWQGQGCRQGNKIPFNWATFSCLTVNEFDSWGRRRLVR